MPEYHKLLERTKRGEIHGIIFAVDHGDPWHHAEINKFMEIAKNKGVSVQLLEESLNEEKIRYDAYMRKLRTAKELGKIARAYGITNKDLYMLSTEEALKTEQKAIDLAIARLNEGKRKDAESIYNLARGIALFKRPEVRERYLVFERLKKWNALPADSGVLKEMMRIAVKEGHDTAQYGKAGT